MKKRAKLALPDVPRALRDATVTEARARWKEAHDHPSDRMIRMMRYVWMRSGRIPWINRNRLHGGTLGACLRAGLMERDKDELKLTRRGDDALAEDGRWKT